MRLAAKSMPMDTSLFDVFTTFAVIRCHTFGPYWDTVFKFLGAKRINNEGKRLMGELWIMETSNIM